MMDWKPGRGALGLFKPLIGRWATAPGTQPGCARSFTPVWKSSYVRLDARWEMGGGKAYEEVAMFGKGRDGALAFWSFTSDGKQSQGRPVDAADVHPHAIAFEAEMPAGTARMVYWPAEAEGFHFAVESRTKKGWNRFLQHHYLPLP